MGSWGWPPQRWAAALGCMRVRHARRHPACPAASLCLASQPSPTPATPPSLAGEVRGNPTEYYRRAGSGSSVGAGVRVGAVRAEVIRDNNSGKANLWLQYGERF